MRSLLMLIAGAAIVACNGCAAMQAAKLPPKKDLAVLAAGTPRSMVVAELGAPVHTQNQPQHAVDTYSFTQGYSRTAKALRVTGHIVGDISTGFIWELAGIPIEATFTGEPVQVEVGYDDQLRVRWVTFLKGQHLAETGLTAPNWMQPPEFTWNRREAQVAAKTTDSRPFGETGNAATPASYVNGPPANDNGYVTTPTSAYATGPSRPSQSPPMH